MSDLTLTVAKLTDATDKSDRRANGQTHMVVNADNGYPMFYGSLFDCTMFAMA